MQPYTGDVYELRDELIPEGRIGAAIEMDDFRQKVEALEDATIAERLAAEQERLVLVSREAAQKLTLGERELERRRQRRKAAKQARRRNR